MNVQESSSGGGGDHNDDAQWEAAALLAADAHERQHCTPPAPSSSALSLPPAPHTSSSAAAPLPPFTPPPPPPAEEPASMMVQENNDDIDPEWVAAAILLADSHERMQEETGGDDDGGGGGRGGRGVGQPAPQPHAITTTPLPPLPSTNRHGNPTAPPPPPPQHSSQPRHHYPSSRSSCDPRQIKSIIAGGRGFDARKRKWYYTSVVSGERFDGADAASRMKHDESVLLRGQDFDSRRRSLGPASSSSSSSSSGSTTSSPGGEMMASQNDLSHFVPMAVVESYRAKGITKLFDWQVACLKQVSSHDTTTERGGLVDPTTTTTTTTTTSTNTTINQTPNLVYSAPTSGGKTLVAEVLLLQALIRRGGAALFVLPYIALVEEKAKYFREVWREMQISVLTLHGENGTFFDDELDDQVSGSRCSGGESEGAHEACRCN